MRGEVRLPAPLVRHVRVELGCGQIGVSEQLVAGYISTDYRDAITFGILIVMLLVRPQGLMGAIRSEKV